jgi:hypothetical protein
MSEQTMTCDDYEALLPRHLEDDLSIDELAAAERHLATCHRCWTLRDELLDIARAARELPPLSPSRELWSGIAARIETPVIALDTGEHAVPSPAPRSGRTTRLAAAAAALVIATAGMTFAIAHRIYAPGETVSAAGDVAPPSTAVDRSPPVQVTGGRTPIRLVSETQLRDADAVYDREIAELRAALERRRPQLDSATIAIIERNLAVIDTAIAQTKAAIKRNPESALLSRQLDRALGRKVEVLRTAVLLPVTTN